MALLLLQTPLLLLQMPLLLLQAPLLLLQMPLLLLQMPLLLLQVPLLLLQTPLLLLQLSISHSSMNVYCLQALLLPFAYCLLLIAYFLYFLNDATACLVVSSMAL